MGALHGVERDDDQDEKVEAKDPFFGDRSTGLVTPGTTFVFLVHRNPPSITQGRV